MKSAFTLYPALLISVLSIGCDKQAEDQDPGAGGPPAASEVSYLEVKPVNVGRTQQLPGRVVSYQVAEIRPQVSGIIQSRSFEEGTLVEEGQKLYQIDPARYEANLQIAQASLKDAQASEINASLIVERYQKLIDSNAISQQQVDDAVSTLNRAQASVAMAEADVKLAEINLEYTSVHSPISGYISPSSVTKGALVTASQETPLATVRQLDPVYVDISQSATKAGDLQARLKESKGREAHDTEFPVTLFLGQHSAPYPEKGVLDATDPAVDLQTGAIRLRSIFPNPERVLLPGMFVRAAIEDIGQDKKITAPHRAVSIGPKGEKTVWIIDEENQAQRREITTGGSSGNRWIVLEGLNTGDKLIVEGGMKLKEGASVKPEPMNSSN